jgi:hypothetical protein
MSFRTTSPSRLRNTSPTRRAPGYRYDERIAVARPAAPAAALVSCATPGRDSVLVEAVDSTGHTTLVVQETGEGGKGICQCDDYGELCSCDRVCPDCWVEVGVSGSPMMTCNRRKMFIAGQILLVLVTHLIAFYFGRWSMDTCEGVAQMTCDELQCVVPADSQP